VADDIVSEFRDSIRDAIDFNVQPECNCGAEVQGGNEAAGAVLAMPEMQAIRKALRCWWEHCACNDHPITDDPVDGFPDSVIGWVLNEGSNAWLTT
jgi:hypothetical protein